MNRSVKRSKSLFCARRGKWNNRGSEDIQMTNAVTHIPKKIRVSTYVFSVPGLGTRGKLINAMPVP
jgi:hypothetical protein